MATRMAHHSTIPSAGGYVSTRVFDGVRVLTGDVKVKHVARLRKAVAKRKGK